MNLDPNSLPQPERPNQPPAVQPNQQGPVDSPLPGADKAWSADLSMPSPNRDRATPPVDPRHAGLTPGEVALLTTKFRTDLSDADMAKQWDEHREVIGKMLIRLGNEYGVTSTLSRVPMVRDRQGLVARIALIPMLGQSAIRNITEHNWRELLPRIMGECSLMELSAAAGYRTFCFPGLIRGLLKTGKMKEKSFSRMFDTFDFLNTMVQYPMDHPKTVEQLERANGLHKKYKVAGARNEAEIDLFKYIGLNMFYIGPNMRPDITPAEKHAWCGMTVLVSKKMGHTLEGSVQDFDDFIARFEANNMFSRDDHSPLRRRAVAIAQASQKALNKIPTISKERIHGYVPYRVKQILEID
jgi:hypothetical protein